MRYLFLIEMPTRVLSDKRLVVRRELTRISEEIPKRNVFLIKFESPELVEKLKKRIISITDPESKVSYYRLHDDEQTSKQANF